MENISEYLQYLKSHEIKSVNESIFDFIDNKISLNGLEKIASEHKLFTQNVYEKCFKLGRLLKK